MNFVRYFFRYSRKDMPGSTWSCLFCLPMVLLCLMTMTTSTRNSKTTAPSVNVKNLLSHYGLVCGHESICEPSQFGISPPNISSIEHASACPPCSCDHQCVVYGDCCPDAIFMFPQHHCRSTVLRNTSFVFSLTKASMVDTCGINADAELADKCVKNYSLTEKFENPPVTSTTYAHTFLNKYCALCNNVTEFESWTLNIDCFTFADFNFLSSYSEIVNLAQEKDCFMKFEAEADNFLNCSPLQLAILISKCNYTGHWTDYDQDVETACEHSDYNVRYRHYKNVFCYICNPMPTPDLNVIISECNTTGLWDRYEKNLQSACVQHKYTPATFPFKNIYCHICNKNNSDSGLFVDSSVSIDSRKSDKYFYHKIRMRNHNIDYYKQILKKPKLVDSIMMNADNIKPRVNIENITNLLKKAYSLQGVYEFCDDNLTSLIFVKSVCSCKLNCFFKDKCCVETALERPVSCYRENFLSRNNVERFERRFLKQYAMVDGCFNSSIDGEIRRRCEYPTNTDVYNMIPVFDKISNIIYRNFDCFICNQPALLSEHALDKIHPYSLWRVDIKCPFDLNLDFHLVLGDVFNQAIDSGCTISLAPNNKNSRPVLFSRSHCEVTLNTIDKCNVSGTWKEFDADLQRACEDSGPFLTVYDGLYKNIFCSLCNPPNIPDDVSEFPKTCNRTDLNVILNGEAMMEACYIFPQVAQTFPYKNIFCEHCDLNRMISPPPTGFPLGGISGPIFHDDGAIAQASHVRELFGPWNRPQSLESKSLTISVTSVSDSEIFDSLTGNRRNVTCYPGKRLIEDACVPLLTETNNLRYMFAIVLEGEIGPDVYLWNLMIYIENMIRQDSEVDFESFYIVSNQPCDIFTSDGRNATSIRLLIHTTFKVTSYVNRLKFEERLFNMTSMEYEYKTNILNASLGQDAFFVPSMIHQISHEKNCFVSNHHNLRYFSRTEYRHTVVSNLMLCRQIELEDDEFEIDAKRLELSVKHSKTALHYGEFYQMANGNMRICMDDFIRIRSVDPPKVQALESEELRALNITTLVCLIISLVCLFVTFVTYMLFHSLRSIPGINNMCLVFAMFFAQALFQFGFKQTDLDMACKIIGVISHFFWLSTFGCMSVCSFHMYSVFTTMSRNVDSTKKTIIHYILYAFGIPAAIICINIVVIALISEDKSIGYGDNACFLSNRISFYLTFLSPVVIVCFTNIFFFIRTILHIRAKPDIKSNKENRNNVIIYIKLFSITGITWLLMIIDTLFPISAFSFIVAILNGCQGLFIFISFVCNKRVMSLYKNAAKHKRDSVISSSTKSTTFTTSNSRSSASNSNNLSTLK